MGQDWTLGFSASTFLDRTSETSLQRRVLAGGPTDSVDATEQNRVLGGIDDVRLALGWAGSPKFHVGVGAHVFSGSNRITLSQIFPDTSTFTSTTQSGRLSYSGFAASLGIEFRPVRAIGFAIAGRKGAISAPSPATPPLEARGFRITTRRR